MPNLVPVPRGMCPAFYEIMGVGGRRSDSGEMLMLGDQGSLGFYEIRSEGDQVGDNDDASAVYKIHDDDVEDKIAICATRALAELLVTSLTEKDG